MKDLREQYEEAFATFEESVSFELPTYYSVECRVGKMDGKYIVIAADYAFGYIEISKRLHDAIVKEVKQKGKKGGLISQTLTNFFKGEK